MGLAAILTNLDGTLVAKDESGKYAVVDRKQNVLLFAMEVRHTVN